MKKGARADSAAAGRAKGEFGPNSHSDHSGH